MIFQQICSNHTTADTLLSVIVYIIQMFLMSNTTFYQFSYQFCIPSS